MITVADKLAHIEALATSGPQLSATERAAYDRIGARLQRARSDQRRAKQRADAKRLAAAERALATAETALKQLIGPKVDHLWAPARIVAKFEGHWHGPSGGGIHRHECEMVLDRKDLSGPQYRTVRVLRDEDPPPTNARSAPDTMGVAWFAITEQIRCGQIVVLGEEPPA